MTLQPLSSDQFRGVLACAARQAIAHAWPMRGQVTACG